MLPFARVSVNVPAPLPPSCTAGVVAVTVIVAARIPGNIRKVKSLQVIDIQFGFGHIVGFIGYHQHQLVIAAVGTIMLAVTQPLADGG